MTLVRLLVLLVVCQALLLAGERAFEKEGQIYLEDSSGKTEQLTSSGHDITPSLSFDEKTVLFARYYPGDVFRTALYSIDIASKKETLLFARYNGCLWVTLLWPQLAPDGKSVYLYSSEGVMTGGIVRLDPQTQAVERITNGAGFDIIRCGEFFGDLLVTQRKTSVAGMIYYIDWLYSPDGKDLGIAGPGDQDDAKRLLEPG